MQTISQLVNRIGKDYLITNIDTFFDIKYKKCNDNTPKAIFETTYENNLDTTIQTVNNSIELKAVDNIYVCSLVLEIFNPNYKQLLLDNADYILIQKGEFPILKITNNKNPKSGIYVSCDIQYLQTYLECENEKRLKNYSNTISILVTGAIFTMVILKHFF